MKKIFSISLKTIASLVLLLFLWIGAAFLFPLIPVNKNFAPCAGNDCINLYLRNNGMHTDVVFPVQTKERIWSDLFPLDDFKDVDSTFQYIAIGWGSKGFYLETPTWNELKVSTALKAASGTDGTAIHITYLKRAPRTIDPIYGKRVKISREQYLIMLNYIDEALCKDEAGCPLPISNPGYDIHDNFYEAYGRYTIFKTCNVWTSDCLKKAGVRNGWWTPMSASVMKSCPDNTINH